MYSTCHLSPARNGRDDEQCICSPVKIVSNEASEYTKEYNMLQNVLAGTMAGALGTVALNVATYADMAIRGRSASSAPSHMVRILADKAHLPLSSQGVGANDQTAQNRESGLGALLGYVNGLGTGALYGLLRSQLDEEVSLP